MIGLVGSGHMGSSLGAALRMARLLSDGVWRPVHYLIGEDMGMIGSTWDVEWCVVGVDRNWSNNPACRMMRP